MILIQAALERHLLLLPPLAPDVKDWWASENTAFEPKPGIPYQRIHHLINTPRDLTIERDLVQDRGIFQVSLFYGLDTGRVAAMTRAMQIRVHFRPVQYLEEGGTTVELNDTPSISSGAPDGDRWRVVVSVPWSSFSSD